MTEKDNSKAEAKTEAAGSSSDAPVAEREAWGSYLEFFVSSVGLSVGLGNIWRFPYVCYQNGGGSFLIPYFIMLFFVGMPALFVEQSLGQYARVGANKLYRRMSPLFGGVGYGMLVVRFMVNSYYVIILSWIFFYLFAGFTSNLPWGECVDEWNTPDCYTNDYNANCTYYTNITSDQLVYFNKSCTLKDDYCKEKKYIEYVLVGEDENGNLLEYCVSETENATFNSVLQKNSISPAEDYFNGYVLGVTKPNGDIYTWSDYGSLRWELCLCLLLSWILICLMLIKGLKAYGKIAIVITLMPYIVLTALLIYSVQLPGAGTGINYYLTPQWDRLSDINVWQEAAAQILFSLSVGFGSQLVLSSYNKFRNNTFRDSMVVAACNSFTEIYAGFIVFAIVGFIEHETGNDISNIIRSGPSLAFVTYPTAVLEMDLPPLWSFLFFFTLVNLALSSVCSGTQTFIAFVSDEFPQLQRHREKVVVASCTFFFLLGLSMCTNGGYHLFSVFDSKCTSALLILTLAEILAVAWVYGMPNFMKNLAQMGMEFIGRMKPLRYFVSAVLIVGTPAILAVIVVMAWVDHSPMSFGDYEYPSGAEALGWIMELLPLFVMLLFPLWMVYRYRQKGLDGREMLRAFVTPKSSWYHTEREMMAAEKAQQEA